MTATEAEKREEHLRKCAIEFYENTVALFRAQEQINALTAKMAVSREAIRVSQDALEASVQPRCGSAHLPSRRAYCLDRGHMVLVQWDDKFHRAAVEIVEMS